MTMLFEAGADVSSARGPLGDSLKAACSMGRVGAIKWLLQHGAGPVGDDDAMVLASKYPRASKLLNQYKEASLEGLETDSTTTPAQSLTIYNTEPSVEAAAEPAILVSTKIEASMASVVVTPEIPMNEELN